MARIQQIRMEEKDAMFVVTPGTLEIVFQEDADQLLWRATSLPDGIQVVAETWPPNGKAGRHVFTLKVGEEAQPGEAQFIYVDQLSAQRKECDCIACGWLVDAPAHAIDKRLSVQLFPTS